jgi:uncharacterized membrane protein
MIQAGDPNKEDQVLDVEEKNIMAALSYVAFLVLIPLFIRRDNPYVVWHAKQGLVILIGLVLAVVAGQWMMGPANILFLVLLLADAIGLAQALLGKKWKIPIIGDIANRFSI